MARDLMRGPAVIAAAAIVGVAAWSGNVLALPLAMVFPALWSFAPSRAAAGMVAAAYFLAASRGLPQGVMNFYGSDALPAIGLWAGASLGFVLVHALLWTSRPGWGRTLRYGVAAMAMSGPPFGIVGWAHPITAAGIVFPTWNWLGLGAAAIGLLVMTTRLWPIAILSLGGLWIWSAAMWTQPLTPDGWVGVDTQFRGADGQYAGYLQQRDTIGLVKTAVSKGGEVVILPESAIGIWTPTVERLWREALQDTDTIVNAGAVVIDAAGYDNVMLSLTGEGADIVYRERMPVPVSMWQPWAVWTGETGSARAHFFANPVVEFGGRQIAPLICYEQLIIWPILQSMLFAPEIIIATGNGWWTENTTIVSIQQASTVAWAKLFNVPVVFAFNT
ncbi:conjugal transfer protein TraB [Devosia sp. ZW T5_3]|uniref:conjugal transfer protein TraB n=1 Tax=Devosia sp. ZW T5_3 TaxID=3378085 RepID=UPI00385545FA